MTTPAQPPAQIYAIADKEPVFPCWLLKDGEWNRYFRSYWRPNEILQFGFTHWAGDSDERPRQMPQVDGPREMAERGLVASLCVDPFTARKLVDNGINSIAAMVGITHADLVELAFTDIEATHIINQYNATQSIRLTPSTPEPSVKALARKHALLFLCAQEGGYEWPEDEIVKVAEFFEEALKEERSVPFLAQPTPPESQREIDRLRALHSKELEIAAQQLEQAQVTARVCREDAEHNAKRAERAEAQLTALRPAATEEAIRLCAEEIDNGFTDSIIGARSDNFPVSAIESILRRHLSSPPAATMRLKLPRNFLANALAKHGVVDTDAICDPDGYDNSKTLNGIREVEAAIIFEVQPPPAAPSGKEMELRGFDIAVSKVKYWLAGHKGRGKQWPENEYIKCEINDLEELLSALAADRATLATPSQASPAGPKSNDLFDRLIRGDGCMVYLDGRNEHGAHIIDANNGGFDWEALSKIETENDPEFVENVFKEAEEAGFKAGDYVWINWRRDAGQMGNEGRWEIAPYSEYAGIDKEMSQAITAAMSRQRSDKKEGV